MSLKSILLKGSALYLAVSLTIGGIETLIEQDQGRIPPGKGAAAWGRNSADVGLWIARQAGSFLMDLFRGLSTPLRQPNGQNRDYHAPPERPRYHNLSTPDQNNQEKAGPVKPLIYTFQINSDGKSLDSAPLLPVATAQVIKDAYQPKIS